MFGRSLCGAGSGYLAPGYWLAPLSQDPAHSPDYYGNRLKERCDDLAQTYLKETLGVKEEGG